jgi:hypothetical protein
MFTCRLRYQIKLRLKINKNWRVHNVSVALRGTQVAHLEITERTILHAAYKAEFYIWQLILLTLLSKYISLTPCRCPSEGFRMSEWHSFEKVILIINVRIQSVFMWNSDISAPTWNGRNCLKAFMSLLWICSKNTVLEQILNDPRIYKWKDDCEIKPLKVSGFYFQTGRWSDNIGVSSGKCM